jgi:hypothetical protein
MNVFATCFTEEVLLPLVFFATGFFFCHWFFITGCDSGFGYELALKCVRDVMDVFATCFTEEVCLIGFLKGYTAKYSIIKGSKKAERMLRRILHSKGGRRRKIC